MGAGGPVIGIVCAFACYSIANSKWLPCPR